MAEIAVLLPEPLEARTGGTLYDLRLARELERRGFRVRIFGLSARFPRPGAEDLAALERLLAALAPATTAIVDGLVFAAAPEVMARHAGRLALVALVHHPLAFETGLTPLERQQFAARERAALAHARRVLVPSRTTRDLLLREYRVPFARILVAEPGVDPVEAAAGSGGTVPQLLSVAALIPRKDHLTLIRALAHLADLPWRLDLVGSTARDPTTVRAVREAVGAFGFEERVRFCGELAGAALEAAWRRADLFVSSSRFEGYGMAIAEALARGLPVVAAAGGAVAEVLPPQAGILVPAGHPAALAAALRALLTDPARREALRQGARALAARLPRWPETAATVARGLRLASAA